MVVIIVFSKPGISSPIQAFSHSICRAKSNLIRWRKDGKCPIDVKIYNIEKEISDLEGSNANSLDPWSQTSLIALTIDTTPS